MSYAEFLSAKLHIEGDHGFDFDPSDLLYPFQQDLVTWAARKGRAALFADCGLGKTPMQLAWADAVARRTGRPVLLLAPLAVSSQTVTEAAKFGYEATVSRDGTAHGPITVTNYDRLHLFDRHDYDGLVCDESSSIKAFDGVLRKAVTDFARAMPYRLLATATAAPNDYTELGTSSEALGYLGHVDMLGRYFTNREGTIKGVRSWDSNGWRFKGHAEEPFWQWVASWARSLRRPSDLGYSDDGYDLPKLRIHNHTVAEHVEDPDRLFTVAARGLQEERSELSRTSEARADATAALVDVSRPSVSWCHTNADAAAITRRIPGAVEVRGSDSSDAKEEALQAFASGDIRHLVTKPSIAGWGLNWQHCSQVTYVPSHSYEQWYQAVRRCWRYGQTDPVDVHVVATRGTARVVDNLRAKSAAADRMFDQLTHHMREAHTPDASRIRTGTVEVPEWLT